MDCSGGSIIVALLYFSLYSHSHVRLTINLAFFLLIWIIKNVNRDVNACSPFYLLVFISSFEHLQFIQTSSLIKIYTDLNINTFTVHIASDKCQSYRRPNAITTFLERIEFFVLTMHFVKKNVF